MEPEHLDLLDTVVESIRFEEENTYNLLSTGEKVYVALAANAPHLLKALHLTIPAALYRIDPEDLQALIVRWGNR